MRFIAIVKTVGELAERREDQKNLPALYPAEMVEFDAETLEEAQALHPGRTVMLVSDYVGGYQRALADIYEQSLPTPTLWERIFG